MSDDTILLGVVGSTAYGLATPTSDVDRLGVFQLPSREILGRWGKGEHHADSRVTKDPDMQLHELGKYVRLAAEANPTAIEALWLNSYEVLAPAGQVLVDHRSLFLSQRARPRYIGYARSQVERLLKRGDFDPDLKKRTKKHGRHCARLLIQAAGILEHGILKVRLDEDQVAWCFEMGELADSDHDTFAQRMDREIEQVDAIDSFLPEHPDDEAIRSLLVDLRLADLYQEPAWFRRA